VLTELVRPLTAELAADGVIDGWFFLRYADPDEHLRVRLHGAPDRLLGALPALHRAAAPFLADGLLWRIGLDTYQREVERYGGPAGILLAERLFCVDSEAVGEILAGLEGDTAADARWRLALLGCDLLLADLGLDLPARLALMTEVRARYAREHHADVLLERKLGEKFRAERLALEALLDPRAQGPLRDPILGPGVAALRRRAQRLAPIVAELAAAPLTVPLPTIAPSYLHLHCIRMLRGPVRRQELVVYDFLRRLYQAEVARGR
jgi:lantibiotic biosynthesis protein